MKCTRKTEDKLRKIVFFVLLLFAAAVTTFAAIVFIQEFLMFLALVGGWFVIHRLISWLVGDISFCKNK